MTTLGEHNMKEYNRLFNKKKSDGWTRSKDNKKVEYLWHEKDKILHAELLRSGTVTNAEYTYKLNYSKRWIQRTRT